MHKSYRHLQLSIFFVDVLLMYCALILALLLRNKSFPAPWSLRIHLFHFSIIFVGWVIVFYTLGMYRLERPFDDLVFLQRVLLGSLISGLASAGYFYLAPSVPIEPKTVLFLFVVLYTVMFWCWRYGLAKLRRLQSLRVGVGFIELQPTSFEIIYETLARSPLGYDIRFVYNPPPDIQLPESIRRVLHEEDLRVVIEETDTDLIILGENRGPSGEMLRALFALLDRRVRFMRLSAFYELVVRRVPVGLIDESWFLENVDLKAKKPYEIVKRGIDIIMAVFLLVVTSPFWLLIALAIKATSKGPVFFRQTRLGRFELPFTILKFRTMRTDGNGHEPTQVDDPRITPVGSFLRSTRLDELPQLLNILKGDMSFIGPRPERPDIAYTLGKEIPYYRQRHLVKPGVTGWDQVSGQYHSCSVEDTYKKLQYDLYYLKNMSLYLDVSIFFKTIITVLKREGR
ncbi:MAG TPA: sugar transferase [Rectinema sp.]|nr:MAG: UDP-N-acetylgalactosamine-undecaprenyl-phosphate N-acetylgalactosaminephosphotransferase [Spirochaetes bacterium ADurb.Bin110]HNV35508.1 sugar transferase [Rectinema sp.]HPW01320.1 sugar transferase [Rectinema sp.]HQN03069.1 sugar transferase [Rectinema sp.]